MENTSTFKFQIQSLSPEYFRIIFFYPAVAFIDPSFII